MDNSSSHHFHQGIDSTQFYKNDNYETIGGNEAYTNFDDIIDQLPSSTNTTSNPLQVQQPPSNVHCSNEFDDDEQSWKIETIECKEEMDHMSENRHLGSQYNVEYENYGDNSPHYDCSSSSAGNNSFSTPQTSYRENSNNVANYSPYQMSATSKNQLPTWYHPPIPPQHYQHYDSQQHPGHYSSNFYPQHHHSYQANYLAPAAASTSSTTEHNMRNMIHMTSNRYILFNILSHTEKAEMPPAFCAQVVKIN